MKKALVIFFLFVFRGDVFLQISFSSGESAWEFSSLFSSYYSHHVLNSSAANQPTNTLKLKDARFKLKGFYKNRFSYTFEFDVIDALNRSFLGDDPALLEANFTWNGPVDLCFGFGKTPYSLSSMIPFKARGFWQRSSLTNGTLFYRRDLGLTLSKSFLNKKLKVFLGGYSGSGGWVLQHMSSPSEIPEAMARVEFSPLGYITNTAFDLENTARPLFKVGLNACYSNKSTPLTFALDSTLPGDYFLHLTNGSKTGYGADLMFKYKGLSLLGELHQFALQPNDSNNALFVSQDPLIHNGVVFSGGYTLEAHYLFSKLKYGVSARFEEHNLNDLATGIQRNIRLALHYFFNQRRSSVQFNATHVLEEESLSVLPWKQQFRLGLIHSF